MWNESPEEYFANNCKLNEMLQLNVALMCITDDEGLGQSYALSLKVIKTDCECAYNSIDREVLKVL